MVTLRVPDARDGSDIPAFLEPRARAERALLAVVQVACIAVVSTGRVDEVVKTLGLERLSKSHRSSRSAKP